VIKFRGSGFANGRHSIRLDDSGGTSTPNSYRRRTHEASGMLTKPLIIRELLAPIATLAEAQE
jgi:hypothetical protein